MDEKKNTVSVTSTKTIIQNANLRADEYSRLTMLLKESTEMQVAYHRQILVGIDRYTARVRSDMRKLITSFDYEIESGRNYDNALRSLTTFAKSMGIALQYADYNDFETAMIRGETFHLE